VEREKVIEKILKNPYRGQDLMQLTPTCTTVAIEQPMMQALLTYVYSRAFFLPIRPRAFTVQEK
jgi:hypothetical protein